MQCAWPSNVAQLTCAATPDLVKESTWSVNNFSELVHLYNGLIWTLKSKEKGKQRENGKKGNKVLNLIFMSLSCWLLSRHYDDLFLLLLFII
jgi:hypothetical protein